MTNFNVKYLNVEKHIIKEHIEMHTEMHEKTFSLLEASVFGSPLLQKEGVPVQAGLLKVCSLGHLGTYTCKFVGPALDLLAQELWD